MSSNNCLGRQRGVGEWWSILFQCTIVAIDRQRGSVQRTLIKIWQRCWIRFIWPEWSWWHHNGFYLTQERMSWLPQGVGGHHKNKTVNKAPGAARRSAVVWLSYLEKHQSFSMPMQTTQLLPRYDLGRHSGELCDPILNLNGFMMVLPGSGHPLHQ